MVSPSEINPISGPADWKGIPEWAKLLMVFIDRVGFPILAFCLMAYMCLVSLSKVTSSIQENTKILTMMQASIENKNRILDKIEEDLGRRR